MPSDTPTSGPQRIDPVTGYPIIEQRDELAEARSVAGPESDDSQSNE